MSPSEQIFNALFRTTYTRYDFLYRVELLKEFFESEFFKSRTSDDSPATALAAFLETRGEAKAAAGAFSGLDDSVLRRLSPQTFYGVLEEAKAMQKSRPQFVLYAPVELPSGKIAELGAWVRYNVDGSAFLAPKIDPALAAGCAFVWGGAYYDFSLKYFFKKHKGEILNQFDVLKNGNRIRSER